MSALQDAKLWLIAATALGKDALHVYVGLLLFLGSAALFRWPLSSVRPWLIVLAAALGGEVWDRLDRMREGIPQNAWGNWKDIWNTLFWPTVLLLLARHTRLINGRSAAPRQARRSLNATDERS